MATSEKPSIKIDIDGDEYAINISSTFKTFEIKFRLGQEFEYQDQDGIQVKAVFQLENGKLIGRVSGENGVSGSWTCGDNEVTLIRKASDVLSTQVHERAQYV
jgi:hypothetical protein